jgi:hypothetical protein
MKEMIQYHEKPKSRGIGELFKNGTTFTYYGNWALESKWKNWERVRLGKCFFVTKLSPIDPYLFTVVAKKYYIRVI